VPLNAIVPAGFERYARVFHPAWREQAPGHPQRVRWAEAAKGTTRVMHPQVEWSRIAEDRPSDSLITPPLDGEPERADCLALADVLRDFTTTPGHCWFGVWDGYSEQELGAKVDLPDRSYYLSRGPIESVRTFGSDIDWRPPNLWWSSDHAWCVSSEVDLASTYVGASAACVAKILEIPSIEAMLISDDARVDSGADLINTTSS